MGIIRAAVSTVKGSLEDQWLEVVEPYEMDAQTVCTRGGVMRKGREKKGSPDVLSNGSVIHVDENQFMILTDGGRIIDYTAEPGYYTIEDFAQPSMFSGQFGEALKDTFNRFRFPCAPASCHPAHPPYIWKALCFLTPHRRSGSRPLTSG